MKCLVCLYFCHCIYTLGWYVKRGNSKFNIRTNQIELLFNKESNKKIIIENILTWENLFQIRDGTSADSAVLNKFCGSQVPDPVTTTQNSMWVKFVSDGSVHNTGFQATYAASSAGIDLLQMQNNNIDFLHRQMTIRFK